MSNPTAHALEHDPAQSQWSTPMWLARKMAAWCWRGARVLEPCAGEGNLIAALLELGHLPSSIIAIERDPRFALHLQERFPRVSVTCGDFLELPCAPRIDCVLMNSPFEKNAQMHFALKALETARECVLLAPTNIEFSLTRDEEMWRTKAQVARRARLPVRPRFGGPHTASFDSVVLKLKRRDGPRRDDEIAQVSEEVWRP
ncbi:MAG: hypothetical protein H0X39_00310 [Actinobacteria bacterium]|nr:hypothetical protein [Gemmatimonadaceae bacterium]MBA3841063.1 hypothetical protein [Actinomycetota bacterium]